jgi:hypothetical protein
VFSLMWSLFGGDEGQREEGRGQEKWMVPGEVTNACNPSYSGGRGGRNTVQRPAQQKCKFLPEETNLKQQGLGVWSKW